MRISLFVVVVLLTSTAFGCSSREDRIEQSFNDLFDNTVAAIEEADSGKELQKVVTKFAERRQAIFEQLKGMSKERLNKLARDLNQSLSEGEVQLREALAKAHERLLEGSDKPVVKIATSMGDIKIELYPALAPETVANFLQYVDNDHYDGTIFHRVIDGFMIQGGGFTPSLQEKKSRGPIRNEAANALGNKRGTIAMARTNQPHSATDQFYINVADNRQGLDKLGKGDGWGYTVFGKVIDGMNVVDSIAKEKTESRGRFANLPQRDVVIESVERIDTK